MTQRITAFLDILLMLLALGALVPFGHALITTKREPVAAVIGHVILNCVFTMSAGLILVWQPDAHPVTILGAGALLSSLGIAGMSKWAKLYLTKRFGAFQGGEE